MSDGRTPPPDFNAAQYERPNRPWLCGHTCDGCPCRIGPSPSGECRATTECTPELVLRGAEVKGTWKCTRPKDRGGPCETGPLPNGTCCRSIQKCLPVRSLRSRRGLVTRAVVAAVAALLLIGLGSSSRETFINPAPLSRSHSGQEFARRAVEHGGGKGCVLCHQEVNAGIAGMVGSAVQAAGASLTAATIAGPHPRDFSRIDRSCVACHRSQSFHQANVARDTSCSVCHQEHRGSSGLLPVATEHCASCHGDSHQMVSAALKSRDLPAESFHPKIAPGVTTHPVTRPAKGYTHLIRDFATDHPEFQALRDPVKDPNPLKFNHRTHLVGDVPPVNGRALDCAYCHQPDAAGAFMQPISFERNCRACHALNFDENHPAMTLPHGDARQVRAYLRSLPTHYGDLALQRGLKGQEEIRTFVTQQMDSLRTRTQSGENLARAVFFADARSAEATAIAGLTGPARAKFAGCAYCHEVTPQGEGTPAIAAPQTPDRWMLHARFNHGRHDTVACHTCHAASQSTQTADVIMPSKQTCVQCHSPKGGVSSECSTCHTYHNEPRAKSVTLTDTAR